MIGATLGHYRITAKLGHGGMGEVYRAEDTRLRREVALKLLPTELSDDEELLARFQREAETVAALNHPNIVTIYSVEEERGARFLTMELVDGKSLDQIVPDGGLELVKLFDLAIPLADALGAAHERGIIHRDLKPANVMVTSEGRIKILDFGLAKLLDESTSETSGGEEATRALTEKGMVLGTIPYMAPEQVQGKPLDRRSDVFSMGVMLYEMATGRRPFSGDSSADLISSILRDQAPPVTEVRLHLPHHLGRIIRHCLEKDPNRRYQSALDVRNELASLRREIESGVVHSETVAAPVRRRGGPRSWPAALGGVALLVLLGVVGWRWLVPGVRSPFPATDVAPKAAGQARPSLAVLYFDNLSGDTELEWLRSGLTDMLVTDLSQSPDLRVLSTDRLYQILSDMKKLDERITSFEVVREVAEEADADTVILGSFAKLGETVRISIKIQEAATGEILEADSVDASVRDEIFARIDDLSRNIRQSIELPEQPRAVADRRLTEVSTDSLEAYRFFVEAEKLHHQLKDREAIELYQKAVELDPAFAMAWAKLGTAHGNLGMQNEERRYTAQAMRHLGRLTEPERAYVEGRFYGQTLETYAKAIATYESTLSRYPHLTALANNLGILYNSVWMTDDAIATIERGIEQGDVFPGSYHTLASAYAAKGDRARAFEVLDAYLRRFPESFSTYLTMAGLHLALGDLGAAEAAVARAEELRPGFFPLHFARYNLALVRADWKQAEAHIAEVRQLPFPFAQSASYGLTINLLFHQGRAAEALELIQPAIAAWPEPSLARAQVHMGAAIGLYLFGDFEAALVHAGAAREEGRGNTPDFIGHGIQVLAHQELGRPRQADLLLEELTRRADPIPGKVIWFFLREVRGRLALARGDAETAVSELESAAAALPRLDGNTPRVWYALAEAYLAAGRTAAAEERLRAITELGGSRTTGPVEFVMSHARLAEILDERGDRAGARRYYQLFVDYWGNGDLERERIAHAREFLAETS